MNESRTLSILQRIPVILAVTAASYGLPTLAQAPAQRATANGTTISRPATSARIGQDSRLAPRR